MSLILPYFPFIFLQFLYIQLRLSDTLSVYEKEIRLKVTADCSPFFQSFQMRLLALKGIEDCIINEKKVAQEEKKTRDYIPTALSSSTYPQLFLVLSLMKCGINFINFFPLCIDLLVDETSRKNIITPIEELCNTICQLSNLQLFSCWSPLRGSPLKKVPLILSSVLASSGNYPTAAIDGRSTTYWLCSRSRATWSVELDLSSNNSSGINIVAIQIAWRPQQTYTASHNSAPKKLSIWVKKSKSVFQNNNNESGIESSSGEFTRLISVDPEYEYGKQNSWTQIYYINSADVTAVQISLNKQSLSNPTNSVKMYSFDVLTEDTESSSLSTLLMIKTVQKSLLPLLKYEILEKIVFDTLLSLFRVSGSLSVGINLIQYLHTRQADYKLQEISNVSLQNLLNSMQNQEKIFKIETDVIGASDKYVTDTFFDDSCRSPEIEITSNGSIISIASLPSTTLKTGDYYCMISAIMDSGIWEWELTMLAVRDATSSFGVAKRPYDDSSKTVSPDVWVVRCVDGEVRFGGKVVRTVGVISPNDVCQFSYDSQLETLSLSLNGHEPYVLFENVPKGTSPIVFLSEVGKSVKLGCVRFKPHQSTGVNVRTVHTLPAQIEGGLRMSNRDGVAVIPITGVQSGTGTGLGVGTGMGIFTGGSIGNILTKSVVQHIPQKCSTVLLSRIAKLSKAKIVHFVEQGHERRKHKIVLDCPYCVEVSCSTLNQLATLLKDVITNSSVVTDSTDINRTVIKVDDNVSNKSDCNISTNRANGNNSKNMDNSTDRSLTHVSTDENEQQILSILQIIDSQLFCLNHSEVDLATVGFPYVHACTDTGNENLTKNETENSTEQDKKLEKEKEKEREKEKKKVLSDSTSSSVIIFDPVLSVPTVQLLSTILTDLRESCTEDIRMAAARAFARGNCLFLPNAEDKINFMLTVLTNLLLHNKIDSATFLLLEMLSKRLSRPSEVLQIIQLYKRTFSARKIIIQLLKNLLLVLQMNANFTIPSEECSDGKESSSVFHLHSTGPNFCKTVYKFFGRFQEQLIYDISSIRNMNDATSTSTSRRDADLFSLGTLLVAYNKILAECSLVILEKANEHARTVRCTVESVKSATTENSLIGTLVNYSISHETDEKEIPEKNSEKINEKSNEIGNVIPGSHIEKILHDTIPSLLLLPFLHGITILGSPGQGQGQGQGQGPILDIDVITEIIPTIINLLDKFSLLTYSSISCKTAMNMVNASIYRAIRQPVVTSGVGGWKTINASFEDNEASYKVSEHGQLYTSTHCSNTCGVVDIGFDRTMKAAWEFQLTADSLSDECSVFGAARLPITSRCYSSSPDLWMRRAYNGYLYAQGNTRGVAMEKIHPEDIIRIEFDGMAGTLSFSLNGSEPEIGFTDITGEHVCTSYKVVFDNIYEIEILLVSLNLSYLYTLPISEHVQYVPFFSGLLFRFLI